MVKIVHGERIGAQAQLSISTSAVIFDHAQQKILLTRRSDNGRWCLPGGHMEPGESISEACIREVEEETGLHVHLTRLIGIYSSPDLILVYADGNRYQIVNHCFEAVIDAGESQLSDETVEIGYFTPEEIIHLDFMEHHRQRIQDALMKSKEIAIH